MAKIVGLDGYEITKGDTEADRLLNAFYCGQIQAFHHLVYFLWRGKRKYKLEDIFRFTESRYCYLIKEYPNFYNQLIKGEQELKASGEMDNSYHILFEEMMKHFKDISKSDPKIN